MITRPEPRQPAKNKKKTHNQDEVLPLSFFPRSGLLFYYYLGHRIYRPMDERDIGVSRITSDQTMVWGDLPLQWH